MTHGPGHGQSTVATVLSRLPITERLTRVTLSAPGFVGLLVRPAQDLELRVPDEHGSPVTRRYTVRHARPGMGEVDLDVVIAGHDGPGVRWATTAAIGSTVAYRGPRGKLEVRPADWQFFVGDETSLPAIAALTESLTPSDPRPMAIIEVTGDGDELPIAADTVWLHNHGEVSDAVAATELPAGTGQVYLLGESHLVRALRDDLKKRGVPGERIFAKGYWTAHRTRTHR